MMIISDPGCNDIRKEKGMNYIKKLAYKYCEGGQYSGTDLEAQDVVDAEYTRVRGYEGSADIEALPSPLSGRELIDGESVIPTALLDKDTDPYTAVSAMRSLRIPLYVQKTIDRILYYGLVKSYAGRRYALTRIAVSLPFDKETQLNILSSSYTNNVVDGAAVIGQPGTGKSTAVSIALRRYPRAIVHKNSEGSYVQIPVVKTTAFTNGNLSALFQMFAARLDAILDTGTAHQDLMPRVNIGAMCALIIQWIQTYHIGCWIIEEISFFEFSNSSRSFENIVSIMQETGVFLLVTGNTDFYDRISGNLRLERRLLSSFVNMDETCRDRNFMKLFLQTLWRYMIPDLRPLYTDEIADTVFDVTLGSVDMMTILLSAVQTRYLEIQQKNERTGKKKPAGEIVNKEMITALGEKHLGRMRELFKDGQIRAVTEYKGLRQKYDTGLNEAAIIKNNKKLKEKMEMEAAIAENIESGYDHAAKLHKVRESIKDVFDDTYTDKQIESAFCHCEKNIEGFKKVSDRRMIQAVRRRLEEAGKAEKEKKKAAVRADETALYESLQGAMT